MSETSKSEKFCLKWNDFESNVSHAFQDLREGKDFLDVTLACEDNQIEAHKVILSACSKFFHSILKKNPHQHPLVYLKGIRFEDLQSILSFMYMGEVNVAQENLNSFLMVAEELQIKGLTQSNSSKNQNNPSNAKDNYSNSSHRQILEREPKTKENIEVPLMKSRADFADNLGTTQEITEIKEEYSGSEVSQTQIVEDFASEGYSNYEDENFDIASQPSENVYSYSDNQGTFMFKQSFILLVLFYGFKTHFFRP